MATFPSPTPSPRTVVAATDLSETAAIGICWASEIAADHGSRLYILHALSLSGWAMDYVEIDAGIRARIAESARERLAEIAEMPRQMGIEVSWEVRNGAPSEIIAAAVQRLEAGLVVVGTRGIRGLDYLLLGSTAQRVVQRAACPVLTVHPQDADRERPIRRILAATDFSDEAESAVAASLALLGGSPADTEVVLLHVCQVPYELGYETGYMSAASGLQQSREVMQEIERRLERAASPLRTTGSQVRTLVIEGYPPEVIVEQAEQAAADLIAMGTHGRTGLAHVFLGSTAERVIHRAPCPVLTVRRHQTGATPEGI